MFAAGFFETIAKPFATPIAALLNVFYSIFHNYAIAIAIITLIVMIVLLPLNIKATKSQLQMQKFQPEIKRIQQELKHDKVAQQEAMMGLYKENGFNPAGGCLPLLIQAPVMMGMWHAIGQLTKLCKPEGGSESCLARNGSSIARDTFDPGYLKPTTEMFKKLVGEKEMLSFGLDLSKPALRVIQDNVVKGLPYLVLVILVGLLSFYQQKQLSKRATAPANAQMQMVMNIMPIMFGVFSLTFASALIVYFLVQNLFRIGQNAYITNKFYGDSASGDGKADAKPTPSKPSAGRPTPSKPLPAKPLPAKPLPAKNGAKEPKPETPTTKRPTPGNSRPGGRPQPPATSSSPQRPRPQAPKKKK
jgi:YidC/Oxa1 family membrane protein insertase